MQVQQQPPTTPERSSTTPPLDWPHYGIGFIAAVKRGFAKYATFSGRASRSEYWWWALFIAPITFAWSMVVQIWMSYAAVTAALGPDNDELLSTVGVPDLGPAFKLLAVLIGLCVLAIMVPSWAVTVRRLHDSGHSGWTVLLTFIPLVGGIILLVYVCQATAPNASLYGPPATGAPQAGVGNGLTAAPVATAGYQPYATPAGGSGSAFGNTVDASSAFYSNSPGYPGGNASYPGTQGYPAVTANQPTAKAQSNKAKIAIIAVTAVVVTVLVSAAVGLYAHLRSEDDSASSGTSVQTESAPSTDAAEEDDNAGGDEAATGGDQTQAEGDNSAAGDQSEPTSRYGPGSGIGGDPEDPSGNDPDAESTTEPPIVGQKPIGAKACRSTFDGVTPAHSAVNSETTSCDFGEAVRRAYVESDKSGPEVVLRDVYSPFTKKYYKMTCSENGTVTCTGGLKAEVYLY